MRSTWGSGSGNYGGGGWLPFSLHNVPVVRGLLIAAAVAFLLFFFTFAAGSPIYHWLAFQAGRWSTRPWTWLTYPVMVTSPLSLLFAGYWLYLVGGSLERSWGSRSFAVLFFTFAALAALAFVPAFYLLGASVSLAGLWLPLSALTVAWAALDPEMEIWFWGILPLKLKALALIDVLLTYFSFGFAYGPVVGLFALAGPAAAYFYVRKMSRLNLAFGRRQAPRIRPLLRPEPPPRERAPRPSLLRRRQEQREIERLRKLLGEDDDSNPAARH